MEVMDKAGCHPHTMTRRDERTGRDNAYRDYRHLIPLASKRDVKQLLKAIQAPFVDKIDVQQSGLVDNLFASGALNDSDNESIAGKHLPTREEKARRLLDILRGISHSKFVDEALPELCQTAGFLIPAHFWQTGSLSRSRAGQGPRPEPGSDCTRCDIKRRVRLPRMADLLLRHDVIGDDIHGMVTGQYRTAPPYWCKIFRAFDNLPQPIAVRLHQDMEKLLKEYGLHVPHDLVTLMTRGLPCRCMDTMKKTRLDLMYGTLSGRRMSDASIANGHFPGWADLSTANNSEVAEETCPKLLPTSATPQTEIPADGIAYRPVEEAQASYDRGNRGSEETDLKTVAPSAQPSTRTPTDVDLHGTDSGCSGEKALRAKFSNGKTLSQTWSPQRLGQRQAGKCSGHTKRMSFSPGTGPQLLRQMLRELLDKPENDKETKSPHELNAVVIPETPRTSGQSGVIKERSGHVPEPSVENTLLLGKSTLAAPANQGTISLQRSVHEHRQGSSPLGESLRSPKPNDEKYDKSNKRMQEIQTVLAKGEFDRQRSLIDKNTNDNSAESRETVKMSNLPRVRLDLRERFPNNAVDDPLSPDNKGVMSEWRDVTHVSSNTLSGRRNYDRYWSDEYSTGDQTLPRPQRFCSDTPGHSHENNMRMCEQTPERDHGNWHQPADSTLTWSDELERARQNRDLQELHEHVVMEITSADQLLELLKMAVVPKANDRSDLLAHVHDYMEKERQYQYICEAFDNILTRLRSGEFPNQASLEQELHDICNICKDLLAWNRTFILCYIYLDTTTKLTTESTRHKADQVARDLLIIIKEAMMEVTVKLNTLNLWDDIPESDLDKSLFEGRVQALLDEFWDL